MAYSLPLKLHSKEEWKIGGYNSAYYYNNKKTEVKKEAEGEERRK
jgi:hypothetical protein